MIEKEERSKSGGISKGVKSLKTYLNSCFFWNKFNLRNRNSGGFCNPFRVFYQLYNPPPHICLNQFFSTFRADACRDIFHNDKLSLNPDILFDKFLLHQGIADFTLPI